MKKRIFKARQGAFFNDEKAQVYGEFLTQLEKKNGVLLTADVVEAAKPEDSPIHDHFEWDDSYAANLYRMRQARDMIAKIVEVKIIDGEEKPIRAFFNIDFDDEEGHKKQIYVSVGTVVKNEEMREQIINKALGEIRGWQVRYQQYKELALIFGAIEETQKKLDLKPATKEMRA